MDFNKIALKVASTTIEAAKYKPKSKKKPSRSARPKREEKIILAPSTEYSCRIEMAIMTDFEGESSKGTIMKKLRGEMKAAIETAVKITARDLLLDSKTLSVKVVTFDCDVNSIDGYSDDE